MDKRELYKVAVSGAAGNIAYGLFNLLGTGDLFGIDISLDLRLLDLPEKKK
jgi:malate/lactate dehydrogenase